MAQGPETIRLRHITNQILKYLSTNQPSSFFPPYNYLFQTLTKLLARGRLALATFRFGRGIRTTFPRRPSLPPLSGNYENIFRRASANISAPNLATAKPVIINENPIIELQTLSINSPKFSSGMYGWVYSAAHISPRAGRRHGGNYKSTSPEQSLFVFVTNRPSTAPK